MNKLREGSQRKSAMSLFIRPIEPQVAPEKISFNPFKDKEQTPLSPIQIQSSAQTLPQPERLDSILENHDSQIKLGLAHDRALDLLNRSVEMLSTKLDDIKADKLPQVVSAASKTVESIRRERSEASKNKGDHDVHYHFYTPEQRRVDSYEVIDVSSAPA